MEVGDSRNLHGDSSGINTVYTVTKAGTTKTDVQNSLNTNKNIIVTGLSAVGITGTTVRDSAVTLSSTTASKSSASSGTSSHVAIMICALAAVMIPTTLL